MKEIDFNPATMTRATFADVQQIHEQLWGLGALNQYMMIAPREDGEVLDLTQQERSMNNGHGQFTSADAKEYIASVEVVEDNYAVRLANALSNLKSVMQYDEYAHWICSRLGYTGNVSMLDAAIAMYSDYVRPVDDVVTDEEAAEYNAEMGAVAAELLDNFTPLQNRLIDLADTRTPAQRDHDEAGAKFAASFDFDKIDPIEF